jgi:hypothetical protein
MLLSYQIVSEQWGFTAEDAKGADLKTGGRE